MVDALTMTACLLPVLPGVAALVILLAGPSLSASRCRTLLTVGLGSSLVALIGWTVMAMSRGDAGLTIERVFLFRWLAVGGTPEVDVSFALLFDRPAIALVATLLATAMCIVWGGMRDEPDAAIVRRFTVLVGLTTTTVTLLVLSSNLLQWMIFQQATLLGAALLVGLRTTVNASALAARKVFLANRVGDVLSLLGILLAWTTFESLDFAVIFGEGGRASVSLMQLLDSNLPSRELAGNQATITVIVLCLFAGAAIRCAQFPLFGWLQDAARGPASVNAIVQAVFVVPTGAWIVFRSAPLLAASPMACGVVGFVGAFTVLLTAATAVVETDSKQVLASLSAGWMGFVFLGLGTGTATGLAAAFVLMLLHSPLRCVLSLAGADRSLDVAKLSLMVEVDSVSGKTGPVAMGVFALATGVLVSGVCGQHAILAASWSEPSTRLLFASVVCAGIGWFLQSLAVSRLFFVGFGRQPLTSQPVLTASLIGLGVTSITIGLLLGLAPEWGLGNTSGRMIAGIGPEVLVVLLGAILSWMAYSRPSPWPERISTALDSLVRSSRRRFYLDDVSFLVFAMPVRGLAQLCRFADWFLVDGLVVGLPSRLPVFVAGLFGPLQRHPVQFYVLAILLALAALLMVLANP
jgi:NADH-quinone oxidoreductase subunit L